MELCDLHNLNMVMFLELWLISGTYVDDFIRWSHFDRSYCIKTMCYSCGIWVLSLEVSSTDMLKCGHVHM